MSQLGMWGRGEAVEWEMVWEMVWEKVIVTRKRKVNDGWKCE